MARILTVGKKIFMRLLTDNVITTATFMLRDDRGQGIPRY